MYEFYLDSTLLPIAPSKLTMSINNQNSTVSLISGGEINFLNSAGLTDISFEVLLPQVLYPFAVYESGFQSADFYLSILEELKVNKEPFQFIVIRTTKDNTYHSTNIKVSLEDYTTTENASNSFDIMVDIKLKQYAEFSTSTCNVSFSSTENTIATSTPRETTNSPEPTSSPSSYTVVKGDCLWNIAKAFYGDGSLYLTIYNANKSLIDGDNVGTSNPLYTIYPNQVFTIPVL